MTIFSVCKRCALSEMREKSSGEIIISIGHLAKCNIAIFRRNVAVPVELAREKITTHTHTHRGEPSTQPSINFPNSFCILFLGCEHHHWLCLCLFNLWVFVSERDALDRRATERRTQNERCIKHKASEQQGVYLARAVNKHNYFETLCDCIG